jgi:ABC-type polar amino acid transport system ATPase subunit
MGDLVVDAVDVHKSFGELEVLRGVDLQVTRGEVVCILGPSGGGKSTFLRTLNCLETIDRGTIRVCGERVGFREGGARAGRLSEAQVAKQRRRSGMVFQQFNLFSNMNVIDNVAAGPVHVLGTPKPRAREEADALLKLVGLADKSHAYPLQLSGGQQQRVAIARALAMKPELMLFDEPTSALDPEMVKEVLDVLFELRREGMTMILVTHEMGFARAAADRVALISDGVIAELAPPEQFFTNPQSERTKQFMDKVL